MRARQAIAPPSERFDRRIAKRGEGCWEWTGARMPRGYGIFRMSQPRRNVLAHRFAWERAFGPIPLGHDVCHSCDNPPCVRPEHLFIGTRKANMADMVAKGRSVSGERKSAIMRRVAARGETHSSRTRPDRVARGERHGSHLHPERVAKGEAHGATKLTEDDVREIRRLRASGTRGRALAARYGVTESLISVIHHRKGWVHLP